MPLRRQQPTASVLCTQPRNARHHQFGGPNRAFSAELKKKGIQHTFNYIQGGGHSWSSGAVQKQMKTSFAFVAAGFKKKPKAKPATDKQAPKNDKK